MLIFSLFLHISSVMPQVMPGTTENLAWDLSLLINDFNMHKTEKFLIYKNKAILICVKHTGFEGKLEEKNFFLSKHKIRRTNN